MQAYVYINEEGLVEEKYYKYNEEVSGTTRATVEPDKTLELFRVKTRYCGRYRVLRMRTSRTSISRSVTIRYCGR